MTSTEEIQELRQRLDALNEQVDDLQQQLLRAEVGQWEARIEAIELQLHLGSMDARDRVAPLLEQLRNRWLDAKSELSDSSGAAADALRTLLDGLESAMRDIRDAVVQSGQATDIRR
jgi:hypothetical protein